MASAGSSSYPLTFDLLVDDLEVASRFEETLRAVHTVLVALAELQEIPSFAVTAVVADDFVAAVQDAISRSDEDGPADAFTVERVGGLVAAKNVALVQDYSNVRIVFDPTPWRFENPGAQAHAIYLTAHELAHVLFGRVRWISGALDGVTFPSETPIELARSIVRIAVEEYRADLLADAVLGQMCSVTVDGEQKPAREADILGPGHRSQLASAGADKYSGVTLGVARP